MEETTLKALDVLTQPDWTSAVTYCDDREVLDVVLLACARAMLPYWEARFEQDVTMERLIARLRDVVQDPTDLNRNRLLDAVPKREKRAYLSMPDFDPGFIRSDCPADFAGDAIFHAACEVGRTTEPEDEDAFEAFQCATECIARVLAERGEGGSGIDIFEKASVLLRERIVAVI